MISPKICHCIHPFFRNYAPVSTHPFFLLYQIERHKRYSVIVLYKVHIVHWGDPSDEQRYCILVHIKYGDTALLSILCRLTMGCIIIFFLISWFDSHSHDWQIFILTEYFADTDFVILVVVVVVFVLFPPPPSSPSSRFTTINPTMTRCRRTLPCRCSAPPSHSPTSSNSPASTGCSSRGSSYSYKLAFCFFVFVFTNTRSLIPRSNSPSPWSRSSTSTSSSSELAAPSSTLSSGSFSDLMTKNLFWASTRRRWWAPSGRMGLVHLSVSSSRTEVWTSMWCRLKDNPL